MVRQTVDNVVVQVQYSPGRGLLTLFSYLMWAFAILCLFIAAETQAGPSALAVVVVFFIIAWLFSAALKRR